MSSELAGRLRERITIERRDDARDALGGAAGEWLAIGMDKAGIEPAGRDDAQWRVTMRPGDVAAGDRMLWRGLSFAVRQVVRDPRTPDRMLLIVEEER